MKKFRLLSAIIALSALFTACKKETLPVAPQPAPGIEKNPKTKSYSTSAGYAELTTFSFDAQGRLTSDKEEQSGTVQITAFDYSTPGKITTSFTENSVLQSTSVCTLNSNGYITEMIYKDGAGNPSTTYKFTYDANGYVTKKEWTYSSGITDHFEYKIENGNTTEAKLFHNGVLSSTTVYTYNLAQNNTFKYAATGHWYGNSFGKASKNLLTNTKTTNAAGAVTWNVNYTHQLNAEGYLVKTNFINTVNNISVEEVYTYE